MAKDISVSVASETQAFQKGIKDGVIEPLDGAVESIEELGKSGDKTGDKLEDSMKDAQKKTELLGDEYTQLEDKIRQIGKQGSDSFKKVKEGTQEASDGVRNLKEESVSTAREAAASFDGSASSITDAFQEVAANAFVGFGTKGIAAGLAAAAGMGIVAKAIADAEEQANKAKEKISELGLAIVDSGEVSAALDAVIENLRLIVTNADDAPKKFEDIKKAAKDTGIEAAKLAAAYSGNKEALDAAVKTAQKAYEEEQKLVRVNGEYVDQVSAKEIAVGILAQELVKLQAEQAAAAQIEKDWLATGGNELVARAEMVSAVNDSYDDLAGSVEDFVNTETGLFDTTAYVTAMQEREQALKDYQSSITTSGLSPEAQTYLDSLGVEAASKMLAGYKSSEPATKKELDRIWKEASKEASGSVETNLDGVIDKPRTAKITADVNTTVAQEDLDNLIKARTAIIKVEFRDRNGKLVD